jgi:purine-cytosine permease-like protein
MVITGILMASVTIFGCKAIVWLNRLAIPGLVVLLAWLTYRIVTVYSDKLDSSQATGDISFFAVINLLPAGMAALILGADYGRYVKSERVALGAPLSVIVFFAIIASLGVVSAAVAEESSSSAPKKSRRPSLRSSYSEISRSRSSICVRSVSITAEATWSRPAERRTDESSF